MNVDMTIEVTRADGRVLQISGGENPHKQREAFLEFRLPDLDLSARTEWALADPEDPRTQSEPPRLRLKVDGAEPREVVSRHGLLYESRTLTQAEPTPLEARELIPFWVFLKDLDVEEQNFATNPPISLFGLKDWASCVGGFVGAGGGIGGSAGMIGGAATGPGGAAAGAATGAAIGGSFGGAFGIGYCTAEQVMQK
jgi:hypothetical protein